MVKQAHTITIDGSYGEGGGQILRTACALSAIAGLPCRVFNIRKNRRKPGLKLQHVIGIRNLTKLCNGSLEGDSLHSQEVFFRPGEIRSCTLNVQIETAGSITLVLQTLLLPAFFASGPVRVGFQGGATDTFFSPTMDYYRFVFLKILEKLGLKTNTEIVKRGFYPKGNAMVTVEVVPRKPENWSCSDHGSLNTIKIISGASETLKGARVAERQAEASEELLRAKLTVPIEQNIEYYSTLSTGSQINIIGECENSVIGSDALGQPGKRAERVGKEAALQFLNEVNSGACLDRFACDQILPYVSLADGNSIITVSEVSEHARTNFWVIEQFLDRSFEINKSVSKAIISIV
ncbi:MAG: RNA 3'-terminal phosphate cyclase [Deltaproteobacteria bacterium]|nr:RNA 3'-terminal phosphate cyclase [Deltaproteobacteria bacterium]